MTFKEYAVDTPVSGYFVWPPPVGVVSLTLHRLPTCTTLKAALRWRRGLPKIHLRLSNVRATRLRQWGNGRGTRDVYVFGLTNITREARSAYVQWSWSACYVCARRQLFDALRETTVAA